MKARKKCADLDALTAEHTEKTFFVPANFALKIASGSRRSRAGGNAAITVGMKSVTRNEMDNSGDFGSLLRE